jgi:hypothetical protein
MCVCARIYDTKNEENEDFFLSFFYYTYLLTTTTYIYNIIYTHVNFYCIPVYCIV